MGAQWHSNSPQSEPSVSPHSCRCNYLAKRGAREHIDKHLDNLDINRYQATDADLTFAQHSASARAVCNSA